jgi:hypothetical protein
MQMTWQQFVAREGRNMPRSYLAAIVGEPVEAVRRVATLPRGGRKPKESMGSAFVALFSRWRGRPPREDEWPAPIKTGNFSSYAWLPPEDELLASLVGRMESDGIATVLTERLRRVTGDTSAVRNAQCVQQRMNRLGLWSSDIVGGITISAAAAEVGSVEIVRNAIRSGGLNSFRHGRLIVIAHDEWNRWKNGRVIAPPGYVPLASLRVPLGISSDSKLPEFASMGYIPTAIRCNPARPGVHTTKYGTWYVDPKVAKKLVADRHAGRPMPWHGKPLRDNLKITFKLWQERRHGEDCETCRTIWGAEGEPTSFDDYCRRYPPLAHGAKRHLTMVRHAGMTPEEVAERAGCTKSSVYQAIRSGALFAKKHDGARRVTRTDAARWIARRRPTGAGPRSWMPIREAAIAYGYTRRELAVLVDSGAVSCMSSGSTMKVMREQVAALRRKTGFTEKQAAKKLGVSVVALRSLLDGVNWRGTGAIPLDTVNAAGKRLKSQNGHTLAEAAAAVRRPVAWVRERIKDGTVRVTRTAWDQRRLYITGPMLARLKRAASTSMRVERALSEAWINLATAARLAGVCMGTVNNWRLKGELRTRPATKGIGVRFARVSVMARARRYWPTCRFDRLDPPEWLRAEWDAKGAPKAKATRSGSAAT